MAEDKIEDLAGVNEGSLQERRFGGVSRLYGPEMRARFQNATAVSYTHLTLPTIYSV